MEGSVRSAASSTRKLFEGERVEVRQKEKGLRGSWHSGAVVRVRFSRRVVEYDELLTLDGLSKLREVIPLFENVKFQTSVLRESNATQIQQHDRGYIRPVPPPCLLPFPQSWTKGLLVDAFHEDAWWEGVLLEDVLSDSLNTKVRILFPEEGDELQTLVKNVRVSQEWDEASGQWAVSGIWSDDTYDLSSLKQICRNRRSALKDLWRQRRFSKTENQGNAERNKPFSAPISQNTLFCINNRVIRKDEISNIEIAVPREVENSSALKNGRVPFSSHPHVSSTPAGEKGGLSVSAGQASASSKTSVDVFEAKCRKVCFEQHSPNLSKEQMFLNAKRQGILNSRKVTKAGLKWMCKGEGRLTRSKRVLDSVCEGSGGLLGSVGPLKQKLQHAIVADKQLLHAKVGSSTDCSIDGSQIEKEKGDVNENTVNDRFFTEQMVPKKNATNNEAVGNSNDFLMQVRLSAKGLLMDKGWRIDFQINPVSRKQVAVYVSPVGSKYFSLASACRELTKYLKLPISSGDSTSMEFQVLSAFSIAKGSTDFQNMASSMPWSMQNGSSISCERNRHSIAPQQEGALNSSSSPDNCSTQELRNDLGQPTLCAGRTGKRKQNGKDNVCLLEPKGKKNKSSPKKEEFTQDKVSGAGCRMQVLLSLPARVGACSTPDNAEPPHFKRSTVLSWLIDKGVLKENESVSYNSRKNGHSVKKGRVTREGVICNCCKVVFTLSNFEAHAGSKLHRPSANIFLNDGRSISDCQMQACELQDAKEKKEGLMDSSDDTCGVCGDGGELILCDHCPSTFHPDCIGLKVIPEGDWYCPRCCCGACGGNQLAGIVDTRMHRCSQCELEYHLTCVYAHCVGKSDRVSRKSWFCQPQCEEIFSALRGLVGVAHPIEKGLSWVILRSMNRDHGILPSSLEVMAEYNSKLSVAHGVMQECFVPMVDPRTKINLISQALYNRRSKVTRLDYSGFYTMLLERGDEIISVAAIRVHGGKLAEMPLVGTRFQYRRQGMCRQLVHALEEMLRNIGVERLILPAVPELLDTWKGSFRFKEMSFIERRELIKLNLMSFPGTTLLQKHLLTDAHMRELLCQTTLSEGIDSLHRTPCKGGTDFESTVVALPAQKVLNLAACKGDKKHASAEGIKTSEICPVEKNERLVHNLLSSLGKVNHLREELQPVSQDFHYSPAAEETAQGQVNSLSKGRLRGRIKCKPLIEPVGDALRLGEEVQEDDAYNTKVVLTTTRSKRLVKSCRWVVDGLKELAKDAKQSKRVLSIESGVPKSPDEIQGFKYSYLVEECSPREDGQGNGKLIENVYVRMRRRTGPPFVHLNDGEDLHRPMDRLGNDFVSDTVVESHTLKSDNHNEDGSNSATINKKLAFSLSMDYSGGGIGTRHASNLADTALNHVTNYAARSNVDLEKLSDSSMQATENGRVMDTKFYSRRKKKESYEDNKVIDSEEDIKATFLPNSEPAAFFQPSLDYEAPELKAGVGMSQTFEGQIGKAASHVFKPAPSLCAMASLVPVAVEQGVRG